MWARASTWVRVSSRSWRSGCSSPGRSSPCTESVDFLPPSDSAFHGTTCRRPGGDRTTKSFFKTMWCNCRTSLFVSLTAWHVNLESGVKEVNNSSCTALMLILAEWYGRRHTEQQPTDDYTIISVIVSHVKEMESRSPVYVMTVVTDIFTTATQADESWCLDRKIWSAHCKQSIYFISDLRNKSVRPYVEVKVILHSLNLLEFVKLPAVWVMTDTDNNTEGKNIWWVLFLRKGSQSGWAL